MIILDHCSIPQPHAVVLCSAYAGRIFLKDAQAGNSLSCVEQNAFRYPHCPHIFTRHRRDTGKVLDRIEGAALCRQHCTGIASEPHQVCARGHFGAIFGQFLNLHLGIECTKECLCNGQASHHDGVATIHDAGEACVRGDHAFRCNVMPAAGQPFTKVFGKRCAHKSVEIKSGERKNLSGQSEPPHRGRIG